MIKLLLLFYLALGILYYGMDLLLNKGKFSLVFHMFRFLIFMLLWPLFILGAYLHYKKISFILKPHVKWKYMLFRKLQLTNENDSYLEKYNENFSEKNDGID